MAASSAAAPFRWRGTNLFYPQDPVAILWITTGQLWHPSAGKGKFGVAYFPGNPLRPDVVCVGNEVACLSLRQNHNIRGDMLVRAAD